MKLKVTTLLLAITVVAATGCSKANESTPAPATGSTTTTEQGTTDTTATDNKAADEQGTATNNATDTTATDNKSSESDSSTDSANKAAATDMTTKEVAAVIKKQGIDLVAEPDAAGKWVLNGVKPDRYVTTKDPKKTEPVSIYVFKSEDDLKKGLEDLKTQQNGIPFKKTEYTKGNVLVIYWFNPDLNDGNVDKGTLDAKLSKAVESL
ncbi:hypothetical protein [Paenibacillus bovis]|uniref:Lipoprotein n=1 Tax=Paenibacillus bovis TaxID=1616788 RepID=A0A172ZFR1_9BACL|nr:hypothetical protein [Paenibacillus bovis]ANF96504.1 hypothetical protein AR543_11150 [Paenibacillus bovis]